MNKKSFKGGTYPLAISSAGKLPTLDMPIEEFVPEKVCIPMNMHVGAPSVPCVKKGDTVKIGQIIGTPVGFLGLPIHASVSGEVTEVAEKQQLGAKKVMCITIANDKLDTEETPLPNIGDCENAEPEAIVERIKAAGICGMGGAAFPTHVKLAIPEDKYADTVIINGCECETHLTGDYALMLQNTKGTVDGLRLCMRALSCKRGIIAIEDNKPEAVKAMREACAGIENISIQVMKTKYPQGGEKQLIKAVTGREIPRSKLPVDAHAVVVNVATSAAIADAVNNGKPLTKRITTVTGQVVNPKNLLLRIGTIACDAIEYCGGYKENVVKLVVGGTMMGLAAPDDDFSVLKATGGLVALGEDEAISYIEHSCIRCGKCVEVCPMGLNPARMKQYCDANDMDGAKENNILDCITCGSCSYVCPAHRLLTASFKNMKEKILAARKGTKK